VVPREAPPAAAAFPPAAAAATGAEEEEEEDDAPPGFEGRRRGRGRGRGRRADNGAAGSRGNPSMAPPASALNAGAAQYEPPGAAGASGGASYMPGFAAPFVPAGAPFVPGGQSAPGVQPAFSPADAAAFYQGQMNMQAMYGQAGYGSGMAFVPMHMAMDPALAQQYMQQYAAMPPASMGMPMGAVSMVEGIPMGDPEEQQQQQPAGQQQQQQQPPRAGKSSKRYSAMTGKL